MTESIETLLLQWSSYLSQEGKSDYTIKAYQRGLQHFVHWNEESYEEPFDVLAVYSRDVEQWKSYQAQIQKSAPATINQRLVAVSSFFNWCVEMELIAKAPTHSVTAIRLEKHQPRRINDKSLLRLLRAVHRSGYLRDIAIIELLAGTGIRVGELLAIQVGDLVDLEKRTLFDCSCNTPGWRKRPMGTRAVVMGMPVNA